MNDKLTIRAGVNDLINTGGKNRTSSLFENLYHYENFKSYGRTFEAGIRFNFETGKNVRQKNKTKSNTEEMNRI